MNDWISVKDRLPEHDDIVLVIVVNELSGDTRNLHNFTVSRCCRYTIPADAKETVEWQHTPMQIHEISGKMRGVPLKGEVIAWMPVPDCPFMPLPTEQDVYDSIENLKCDLKRLLETCQSELNKLE